MIEIPPPGWDSHTDDRVQHVGVCRILGARRERGEHLPVHLVVIEVEVWISQLVEEARV
jgi:hypothetical protein